MDVMDTDISTPNVAQANPDGAAADTRQIRQALRSELERLTRQLSDLQSLLAGGAEAPVGDSRARARATLLEILDRRV